MDLGLRGKAALVTGGAGAIGGQIACRLSEEGCAVALADIAPSADGTERAVAAQATVTPLPTGGYRTPR